MGSQPIAKQFPPRNRLISGIAKYVVVVEAKEKSGSLITTDFALEQGKDIYVIPGRITDVMSAGCNRLIAQGAGIITSLSGFIEEIEESHFSDLTCGNAFEANEIILEKDELLVYSCFDFYPKALRRCLRRVDWNSCIYCLSSCACVTRRCYRNVLRINTSAYDSGLHIRRE